MKLLPEALRAKLRANAEAHRAAQAKGADEPDPAPTLKLFHPCSAATWIATELGEDGDTLFGLADLGFGCPELGTFSLCEIERLRLPFGLRIERDLHFETSAPLSHWAAVARRAGSIIFAEQMLKATPSEGYAADEPGADGDGAAESMPPPQAERDDLAAFGGTRPLGPEADGRRGADPHSELPPR